MKVAITHVTRLEYDGEVVESVMDARLGPRTDPDQRWDRFDLRVDPPASIRRYGDAFGNAAHLITLAKPHRHVEVRTRSEVETLLADPFAPPRARPAPLEITERHDAVAPSTLVPRHPRLEALATPFVRHDPERAFDAAAELMHVVHREFTYEPETTTVTTSVAELMETRTGVCQDLAHVLIGLCRAAGIPARYVSGYIVTGDGEAPSKGAGHSHAWVEAWSPTHGWRGLDPTNDLLASEHHVKMAVGRDYRDVPPTQGTFRGTAEEQLSVEVVALRA